MASLYNLEPQPTAKVILNTTAADLTLELFAKQAPLASRNFLQHCLDGYYNNTIFHRLIPNFIIQGGDPTGTGSGGISAINDGEPFQDEFHSRLKFNRRGLLGMANEGKDTNTSHFFLTLGPTPELQGKNTMFGRIEGDTIFNLVKMGDVELADGSERPLYPTKVTGAEIILNPFTDMQATVKEAPRTAHADRKDKKRRKPAGKSGLSFGNDDEDDIAAPVIKKLKVNPKMVAAELDEPTPALKKTDVEPKPVKHRQISPSPTSIKPVKRPAQVQAEPQDLESEQDEAQVKEITRKSKLDQTNAEIAALKASMRRSTKTDDVPKEKPKSALEAMIPVTSTKARKRGQAHDEQGALDMFNAFKQRLASLPTDQATATNADHPAAEPAPELEANGEDEAELCDLHFIANCQSCKSWDQDQLENEADAEDDVGWMSHRLTFAKDTLGKDLEWKRKMEEIEVIDPREKARAIQEQSRKAKVR